MRSFRAASLKEFLSTKHTLLAWSGLAGPVVVVSGIIMPGCWLLAG